MIKVFSSGKIVRLVANNDLFKPLPGSILLTIGRKEELPEFYNELIAFNRKMVEVGFIRPAHAGIMIVDAGLDELLDKMATYEPHKTIFAMKAENL